MFEEEKNNTQKDSKAKTSKGKFAAKESEGDIPDTDTGSEKSDLPAKESAKDEFGEMFKFAKKTKGIEITAEYLDLGTLPPNENVIFIFMGMTTFTGDKGPQPAVMLIDEDKTQYIAAAKVLVTACEKLVHETPVAIGITVKGKSKSAAGNYFDLSVVRY